MLLELEKIYLTIRDLILKPQALISDLFENPVFQYKPITSFLAIFAGLTTLLANLELPPYKVTIDQALFEIEYDSTLNIPNEKNYQNFFNPKISLYLDLVYEDSVYDKRSSKLLFDSTNRYYRKDIKFIYDSLYNFTNADIFEPFRADAAPGSSVLSTLVEERSKIRYAEEFNELIKNKVYSQILKKCIDKLESPLLFKDKIFQELLALSIPSFLVIIIWLLFRKSFNIKTLIGLSFYLFSVYIITQELSFILFQYFPIALSQAYTASYLFSTNFILFWVTYAIPDNIGLSKSKFIKILISFFWGISFIFLIFIYIFVKALSGQLAFDLEGTDKTMSRLLSGVIAIFLLAVIVIFIYKSILSLIRRFAFKKYKYKVDNTEKPYFLWGSILVYLSLSTLIFFKTLTPPDSWLYDIKSMLKWRSDSANINERGLLIDITILIIIISSYYCGKFLLNYRNSLVLIRYGLIGYFTGLVIFWITWIMSKYTTLGQNLAFSLTSLWPLINFYVAISLGERKHFQEDIKYQPVHKAFYSLKQLFTRKRKDIK